MNIIKYTFAFVMAYFAVDGAWVVIRVLDLYYSLPAEAHATGLIDYGMTTRKAVTGTLTALVCGVIALVLFGVIKKDD